MSKEVEQLLDHVHEVLEKIVENSYQKLYPENNDDRKKLFPVMFMISLDGESFQWFILDSQKKYILDNLKKKLPSNINCEEFFEDVIKFKFVSSGMISYFRSTRREVEYISDPSSEDFIIRVGYGIDYSEKDNGCMLSKWGDINSGDPVSLLESVWAFADVPFYYIKFFEKKELELKVLVGLFPLFESLQRGFDVKKVEFWGKVDELTDHIRGYIDGALAMHDMILWDIRRSRNYSLHSTTAAILTRNMAHNIESHVTPRATVEAIRKRLQGLDFSESIDVIQVLKGRLDEYRQKRADFLAEVTSEPLTTTKPAFFYRGVILPLIENVLLMDNIARNEEICYKNKTDNRLRIRVFIDDQELKAVFKCATRTGDNRVNPYLIQYPDNGFPYTGHCVRCNWQGSLESHDANPSVLVGLPCSENRDIEIELPGPVGEHAFYGFLENFIRNVAKHNRKWFDENPKERLEINIRVSEPTDPEERKEFYTVEIWDNVNAPKAPKNERVDRKECKTLHDLMKAYIESDIIDETGKKKPQAYGIAEMKADAMFLSGSTDLTRMKDFLEVCEESKKVTEYCNGSYKEVEKYCLVYRFRLMKAKKMCGVFPNWSNDSPQEQLRNQGIWIFKTTEELKQAIIPSTREGKDTPKSAASFRFAIFDCSGENGQEIANQIPELLPYLPFRIIVLKGKNEIGNLPNGILAINGNGDDLPKTAEEIMFWLWSQWLKRWDGQNDLKIVEFYLDQGCEESPTQEWFHCANQFNAQSNNNKVRIWGRGESGCCAGNDEWNGAHIVFDRHGGIGGVGGWLDSNIDKGGRDAYLLLDKLSPDFVDIFQPQFPQKQEQFWTFPLELIEAGLLRVLVIDERVAEKAAIDEEMKVNGYKSRWEMSKWAKIFICTHFGVNKEPEPLHRAVEGMEQSLKVSFCEQGIKVSYCGCDQGNHINLGENSLDMVIIHQGVLDHEKEENPSFNQSGFLENLRRHIPFVIVDSGRGIPPTLDSKVKFLPFSILNDYILGQRIAKYRLAQVTMSLTRRGGEERE